jgi:hypothetical protein
MGVYGIDEDGRSVLVESAFDATQLEVTQVYVGNTMGVLLAEQVMELDNNSDGLTDLALYYSISEVEPLVERVEQVQYGEIWIADPIDPVGLHYVSANGVDYLVPDIFGLGEPVNLNVGGAAGATEPQQVNATVLYPVRPNPFSAATTIRFNLVTREHVTLRIYDTRGMLVRTLEDRAIAAGMCQTVWDGTEGGGRRVAPGPYFVRFTAGTVEKTEKMMLLE